MTLITNFDSMGERNGRKVIRCLGCGLVQFRPWFSCRRCHIALEEWREPAQRPRAPAKHGPDYGKAIRFWRDVYGYSQPQLAERMGLNRTYVSRLETHSAQPTIQSMYRVAIALDITPRLFILTAEGLARK